MSNINNLTYEEAKELGRQLSVKWINFNPEELRRGIIVESEHGKVHPETNITNDDLKKTAKIALAHLYEFPDYYCRLEILENEAKEYWKTHKKKIYKF